MGHALHNRPVSNSGKNDCLQLFLFSTCNTMPSCVSSQLSYKEYGHDICIPATCWCLIITPDYKPNCSYQNSKIRRLTVAKLFFPCSPVSFIRVVNTWYTCRITTLSIPLVPHTGIDFSRDGSYMALAERRDCKDYVSVFVCDDWHLLRVSEFYGQCDIFNPAKAEFTLSACDNSSVI